jgi:predicted Zn-dependent protease
MQQYFFDLTDHLTSQLQGDEVLAANYAGETSDFVRFNQGRIRQPGSVSQASVSLKLIRGKRHVSTGLSVCGTAELDRPRFTRALDELRERLAVLPEDPYLLYSQEPSTSETQGERQLPAASDAIGAVLDAGRSQDLVGIYAAGDIHRGYACSLGHRYWYSSGSFTLDWASYLRDDKAVKSTYAGFAWDQTTFGRKVSEAAQQLEVLKHPPRELDPGKYRVYLSPRALQEITFMMSWGGFGLRAHRTRTTPFLKLVEGQASLSPGLLVAENTAEGTAPDFNSLGFRKPDRVTMIEAGRYRDCLVSPRSAMEFGAETNGAGSMEFPLSLELGAGELPADQVLQELGTGLLVNNLWYLNFSDRNAFRITGMTRFGTFWVEGGKIVAPTNVMRFDESIYRMLGENLVGLTADREMILSTTTYESRGVESVRLPGALVHDFSLTL